MNNSDDEITLFKTLRNELIESKFVEIYIKEENPTESFISINRPKWLILMVIFINILASSLSFVVFYPILKRNLIIFPLYLFVNLFVKFSSLIFPRNFLYSDVLLFYC